MKSYLSISICLLLFALGCSQHENETAPVKGKVTFNGQPAQGARILLIPADGKTRAAGAETDEKGEYTLYFSTSQAGSPVGPHRVQITYSPPGKDKRQHVASRFTKGEVEVVVEDTENVFDFELTDK